jgi:hypothetical protein
MYNEDCQLAALCRSMTCQLPTLLRNVPSVSDKVPFHRRFFCIEEST